MPRPPWPDDPRPLLEDQETAIQWGIDPVQRLTRFENETGYEEWTEEERMDWYDAAYELQRRLGQEEGYTQCQRCSTLMLQDDTDPQDWCESCNTYLRQNGFDPCPHCLQLVDSSRGCRRCKQKYIKPYDYKPDTFLAQVLQANSKMTPTLFGTEIEVGFNDFSDMITAAKELSKAPWLYLVHDGSITEGRVIRNGFEIVTHPFTKEWANENIKIFEEIYQVLYDNNAEFPHTCGTHFHINLENFSSNHLYKTLSLIYRNPLSILEISGRNNLLWTNKFANLSSHSKKDIIQEARYKKRTLPNKYHATNITPKTLELRFFGASPTKDQWKRYFDFIVAMITYTKQSKTKDTFWNSFVAWLEEEGENELCALAQKGL